MKRFIVFLAAVMLFICCAASAEGEMLYVNSPNGANVRSSASLSGERLGTAWYCSGVTLLDVDGDFAHVSLIINGKLTDGYIWTSLLSEDIPENKDLKLRQVIANSAGLFVRQYPDTESARICLLPCGSVVTVHNYFGSFALITCIYDEETVTGYCWAENLADQCATKPEKGVKLKRFCSRCETSISNVTPYTISEEEGVTLYTHVECPASE